jgi:aminoglycoside phosphotransferase (APT) family kinase protein
MIGNSMPPADIDITEALVRRLLESQHPDLATLPLAYLGTGWDNVMFRLGARYTVRLPRRAVAAELVGFEQRWLPLLAPRLPIPIPVPIREGRPSEEYPWSWSVLPWFDGVSAAVLGDLGDSELRSIAAQLGQFLGALHYPAPDDAPVNPYRGVLLSERTDITMQRFAKLAAIVDVVRLTPIWDAALGAEPWTGAPLWIHGDLHTANVLLAQHPLTSLEQTDRNRFVSAVIDFGDISAGDPATDLSIAWMLFPLSMHDQFRIAAMNEFNPIDDHTWMRARGWAVLLALVYLESSADNPIMRLVGETVISRLLSE